MSYKRYDKMHYESQFALSYTQQEWEILERIASDRFTQKLNSHAKNKIPHFRGWINSSISRFVKNICVDERILFDHLLDELQKENRTTFCFPLPVDSITLIETLSKKSGISTRAFVERIIVNPLFTNIYIGKGF